MSEMASPDTGTMPNGDTGLGGTGGSDGEGGGDGAGGGGDDHQPRTAIRVALIGAAATVAAAVIGGVLAVNAGAVEISLPDSGPSASDLRTTVTSLEQENERLQEQLDEATSTTTTTGGTATTDSEFEPSGPTGTSAGIFRETSGTPVSFNSGSCIDLDSRESNWNIDGGGGDVCLSSSSMGASDVAFVDHEPSLEECRAQTLLENGVPGSVLEPGLQMCLQTGEGRHAYVRVAAVGPERETISLDVKIWDAIDR